MTKKWYHYGMISVWAQLGIAFACMIVLMAAVGVYEGLEEDVVHFEGQCDIQTVQDDDGNDTANLLADCGDAGTVQLSSGQERSVFYHELTHGERPAIMCRYTISEYLGDETWTCDVQTGDEETTT